MIGLLYDITTHYVLSLVSVTDVFNADQSLHWLLAVFVQYISKLINNQDNQQKGFFFCLDYTLNPNYLSLYFYKLNNLCTFCVSSLTVVTVPVQLSTIRDHSA